MLRSRYNKTKHLEGQYIPYESCIIIECINLLNNYTNGINSQKDINITYLVEHKLKTINKKYLLLPS